MLQKDTEYLKKTEELENKLKEKHKDNVSRYFNQRFYPYYEIIENNKRLKYKLSPTGYSKAYSIIKSLKSS